MATCYYLLNDTKQEYLDLGKMVGGHIAEPTSYFYQLGTEARTPPAVVVYYLMDNRGDTLRWVSDAEADLSFLDTYQEFDLASLVSTIC